MTVELLDESNDLVDPQQSMLFKTGMVKEEVSGIFKFGDKSFFKIVDKFEEYFGGIPGIEEDGIEGDGEL